MKTIVLLAPKPLGGVVSGGNRYNAKLLSVTGSVPIELVATTAENFESVARKYESKESVHLVIDSLFWPEISKLSRPIKNSSILVHYLPSTNPRLTKSESEIWNKIEADAFSQVDSGIAVGQNSLKSLRQRFTGKRFTSCEPGFERKIPTVQNKEKKEVRRLSVLTVANLLEAKGYLELLDGLSTAKSCGVQWAWNIVGSIESDLRFVSNFISKIMELGLEDDVNLLGPMQYEDLTKHYNSSDIFLYGSHFESYGMAIAEAKMYGLPVITTSVGEAENIISHEVNGLILKDWSPTEISSALLRLAGDPKLRSKFRDLNLSSEDRPWKKVREQFSNEVLSFQS